MQRTDPSTTARRPLCVGLDGTLVRTDTLVEVLLQLIQRSPLGLFLIPGCIAGGVANFKRQVAGRLTLDGAELPCCPWTGHFSSTYARKRPGVAS